MERFAIYFAPAPDSALGQFGAAWLGRDAYTGQAIAPEDDDALPLDVNRRREITRDPRRYGFHATLKAPFHLAANCSQDDLIAALEAFATRTPAFRAPALDLVCHHGYMALVLGDTCSEMDAFAAACVRDFEAFRAPLSQADIARRKPERLSERQRDQLLTFGYPYIFEDFFFHLTLSTRLSDPEEIAAIEEMLAPVLSTVTAAPLDVDAVCLFHQPEREAPFRVRHRVALTG